MNKNLVFFITKGGIFINNFTSLFFIILIILIIFSNIINFSNLSSLNLKKDTNSDYYFSSGDFFWPLPGFHTITSYFGPRKSPANGSSSNHSGIDIAAPQNTIVYSVISGKVDYVGFYGANRLYRYSFQ